MTEGTNKKSEMSATNHECWDIPKWHTITHLSETRAILQVHEMYAKITLDIDYCPFCGKRLTDAATEE